ncbi:MAG: glycerophosphodiester phosphodiesterase [Nocardioidaceae bacterium]
MTRLTTADPTFSPTGPVLAVAHRGASAYHPENTLGAVHAGVALAAADVEIDVQRTRDGALVVVHDTTLARTTDAERVFPGRGPWRVGDLTLAEIRRLDAGSWHSPFYAGERIPLLSEVVDALRRTSTGLLLEVKAPQLYPGIDRDLAAELRAIPNYLTDAISRRRLVVQSFDHEAMRSFKDLLPAVPVGLLGTPPRRRLHRLAEWADQVNPRHRSVGRGYVDAVHAAGLDCQVWTVDEVADMRRALALGVDGIITNRPDVLGRLLRESVPAAA